MFRVLNPNSKECLVFCFSKNCLSPHFFRCVRYKLSSLLLVKIMSAVAVTPGAVARIRESKEVLKDELNVQVCFIFFITHRGGFRDVVVSRLVDGVVSSFLSSSKTSSATKKFHQRNVSFKKLTTTFFGLLFIHHQVLDFDGSNDAFRCVLFFFFF